MTEFQPYVPDKTSIKDFTFKSVFLGAIFGIVFGAANAYLGLRVGLTISTSIPIAIITVAVFKILAPWMGKTTILDWNMSQTVGSASSSLASGVIFTIPALFLWGLSPSIAQIGTLALLGGLLGTMFMIPLRRFLIVKEHEILPYPEGTATAEVLIAAEAGGAKAKNVFIGLGIGLVYKLCIGFFKLWSTKFSFKLPVLKKAVIGLSATPALLGVGYILNFRIASIMVSGSLLAWVGIIPLISYFGEFINVPLFPSAVKTISQMSAKEIWTNYIRYIGAGAVAVGGIITVIRALPTMWKAFKSALVEVNLLKRSSADEGPKGRRDTDLPMVTILIGSLAVLAVIILTPHIIGTESSLFMRLIAGICITIGAFIFVTVSSRIVGMVGVTSNPTSSMTIMTLLITSGVFYLLGWTDMFGKAAAITVGTAVCVAASIAGDISQDLKSGYLIGAMPRKQQIGQMIGVITCAFFIAASVWLLGQTFQFGTDELPAPQATLMKTIIEGVLSANLPWSLVFIGGAFAVLAELLSIPSLPFAVGIYLPLSTLTPVFVGGTVRYFVEKYTKKRNDQSEIRQRGILLGSGLIAGEGVMGILLALYAFIVGARPAGIDLGFGAGASQFIAFLVFVILIVYMVKNVTKRSKS